jgi:hypothetical protein
MEVADAQEVARVDGGQAGRGDLKMRSEVVASVAMVGSRARGTATGLSDWDLYLEGESADLMAEIPALVASLQPLAAFWEPLSEQAGYMIVMDRPVKVDLFPIRCSRHIQPPWVPGAGTYAAIKAHFWDWALWLGSKSPRGERQLVVDELAKMHWFLLGPLGVASCPATLSEAVASYRRAPGTALPTSSPGQPKLRPARASRGPPRAVYCQIGSRSAR